MPSKSFTPRERTILPLVAKGESNRSIATSLELAEQTVKNMVTAMMTKADVPNRTGLAKLHWLYESHSTKGITVGDQELLDKARRLLA